MKFIDANLVEYSPTRWLSYDDVLLYPQFSSIKSRRSNEIKTHTKITRNYKLNVPIISANMDTVTGADMVIAMNKMGGFGILHRFYKTKQEFKDEIKKVFDNTGIISFSVGVKDADSEELEYAQTLTDKGFICIDVAHGHHQKVVEKIRAIKDHFPYDVIAGNVATVPGAMDLVRAGADCIKVGLGNGERCSTRLVTGHGVATISSIYQCRTAINHLNSNCAIIADGGIRSAGDIVKALAAGADSVMIGGLLAATPESCGERYQENGKTLKKYRGQSSRDFMKDHGKDFVAAEGETRMVEITNNVEDVMKELIMGVRSGMSYCGATDLTSLNKKAVFTEVSQATFVEGNVRG